MKLNTILYIFIVILLGIATISCEDLTSSSTSNVSDLPSIRKNVKINKQMTLISFTDIVPNSDTPARVSYRANPRLPSGIILNDDTGQIGGTPNTNRGTYNNDDWYNLTLHHIPYTIY